MYIATSVAAVYTYMYVTLKPTLLFYVTLLNLGYPTNDWDNFVGVLINKATSLCRETLQLASDFN